VDLDGMHMWINVRHAEMAEIIIFHQKTTDEATRVAGACSSSIVFSLLK
jgi:hypothetical protein